MVQQQTNRFNLIDEAWIPITNKGLVSLKEIFSKPDLSNLAGNPLLKISILKLLLAICQAAATPANFTEWEKLGSKGMCQKVLSYLNNWKDNFWLYHATKPFLQFPKASQAALKEYGAAMPEIASGNTTVFFQSNIGYTLTDAEKAQVLVAQMCFALGGKKTDNSVVFTKNYQGKNKSGSPGPAVGSSGYLHNFILGSTITETLWFNLLTEEEIAAMKIFPQGLGTPPWEKMPQGEDDPIARRLKDSYLGRLVGLCRFILLREERLHYTEGLKHSSHKEGMFDPSILIKLGSKNPEAVWVEPEKRPWRWLTAMLSFLAGTNAEGFFCYQLKFAIDKIIDTKHPFPELIIWSGGLKVSSKKGEQYTTGLDDYVESAIRLSKDYLNKIWFINFKKELEDLDWLEERIIYYSINHYYQDLNLSMKELPRKAVHLFWQLCERHTDRLITACNETSPGERLALRQVFARLGRQVYDHYCPHETARQLEAWAKNEPHLASYLQNNVADKNKTRKEKAALWKRRTKSKAADASS